jgi:hypothetical protein
MGRLVSWAATDRDQRPRLQGSQAVTDMARITSQSPYQVERARIDAALSALILGPHLLEDLVLQFRKASCRHEGPLDQDAISRCG